MYAGGGASRVCEGLNVRSEEETRQGWCWSFGPERLDGCGCFAEMGNAPERANWQHKVKNSLLDTLRLRCLLEIQVQLSRGQLDL